MRTTPLLRVLSGEICWVTDPACRPLLPDDEPRLRVFTPKEAREGLRGVAFQAILSLEEDPDCAALAAQFTGSQLTGVYADSADRLQYTDDSAHWFDMSRISRLGLAKANALKKENTGSWQQHLFRMIGKNFKGEPYSIFAVPGSEKTGVGIGLETRAGRQWPNKQWGGYTQLAERLRADGHPVQPFEQQNDLRNYLQQIAACRHIVSGDTLAMHVALAYGKTCTAIFNCTSPQEIHDYGLLNKIVSPLLGKYFYATSQDPELVESVPVAEVYAAVKSSAK